MAEEAPETPSPGQADSPGSDGSGDDKGHKPAGDRPARDKDDQFSATADPLATAFGGSAGDASADQAYATSWVRTVHSGGPATVFGGGTFRDISIGTTTIYTHDRRDQSSGPILRDVLDELIERYCPVDCYTTLASRLRHARLLVLRGAPGTGRATTGTRLLADVAGMNVSRFGPETDLSALTDSHLEKGTGYLLELAPGRSSWPTGVNTDGLAKLLCDRECFMVLITPHDLRHQAAFGGYTADCPAPDPSKLLGHAVEYEAGKHPELASKLRAAAARMMPGGGDARRLPSEIWLLVQLLISHAAGEITFEEVIRLDGESLSRSVSEWFEPLAYLQPGKGADEQVRLAAFRIALAVLNKAPFDLVAEAGERLATELLTVGIHRPRNRQVFANYRDDYIANSWARLTDGTVHFRNASVPSVFARYDDDRMPSAVLRHVWDIHSIRGPLISWLQSQSEETWPFVWMRAALAIGQLSSWDFAYTFDELIYPWACSPEEEPGHIRRRLVAAVALDGASRSDEVRPVTRDILDRWCRRGSLEQRFTAAGALGYDLGLQDPAKSLRQLRIIGCWEDGELEEIASWAVMRIFIRGGMEPALTALQAWLADDRRATRKLARIAVLRLADLKVADVQYADPGREAQDGLYRYAEGREKWPFLVALAEENPGLRDSFADLVWAVMQSSGDQGWIDAVLTRWMRAGEKDTSCIGPVAQFLALLGDSDSNRKRLLHLVNVQRNEPDEPLPATVADRFARVIETNSDANAGKVNST